jgi:hypothetical protein
MHKVSKSKMLKERRTDPRRTTLRNYRIEIKLIGEPIYQFRVKDVSSKGAGLLVKDDSGFLSLIEVGQIVDTEFISPDRTDPNGNYKAEIKHITKPNNGINEGHCLVGLSILEKIEHLEE